MSAINTVNHYLVRYRNLSGETHEGVKAVPGFGGRALLR